MLHKGFSRFLRLFWREALSYFGEKKVIRKEKTTVDERAV
jgi:hypothetical protein